VEDGRDDSPEEPGVAGDVHGEIERAWIGALEADLPLPPSEPSSSSARGSSDPAPVAPVADPPPPVPWKNQTGYCFLPKDGKEMGVHLGALALLSPTQLLVFLFRHVSASMSRRCRCH